MTDHASWLNGHAIARLQIIDRWNPRIPKHPAKVCTGAPDCLWCNHQFNLRDAGKKSKPLDQCPWLNWKPSIPSQTIPAAERWELIDVVRMTPGGRNRAVGDNGKTVHLGYFATRGAAEAAKHGQQQPD